MPIAIAADPSHTGATTATHPVPGISTTEVSLITASAQRFLHHIGAMAPAVTMAAIAAEVITLRGPHTPSDIGDYECSKPNDMHWCTGS